MERTAMAAACPEMRWSKELQWPTGRVGSGWEGRAPAWRSERRQPVGVDKLLGARRLHLRVIYPEGFPMVPPDVFPIQPEVPPDRRTQHRWHVNGDGSLCLLRSAENWHPTATAADLVLKAAGWFIEYLLVDGDDLDAMTEYGVASSDELDALLAAKFG
jgi:hypothetical protein